MSNKEDGMITEEELDRKISGVASEAAKAAAEAATKEIAEQMAAYEKRVTAYEEKLKSIDFDKIVAKEHGKAKGVDASHFFRAFAAAKGDAEKASKIALEKLGNEAVSKALATNDFDAGGALVPEQFSQDVIERLQARAVVRSLGPTVLPMPDGTLTQPKITGGATARYTGESVAQNASQISTGQHRMAWKKLVADIPLSKELLMVQNANVDQVVIRDTTKALGNAEDTAFIRGEGTEYSPKGMYYWANTANQVAATNASPNDFTDIEADLHTLTQRLGTNNVDMGPGCAWLMSFRTFSNLQKLRHSGGGNLIFPSLSLPIPTLLNYRVGVTNNIPTNLGAGTETELYFAQMEDCVIGEMSGLMVDMSTEAAYVDSTGTMQSAWSRGEALIQVTARHDFMVRHDRSVAVLTGVTY